MINKNLYQIKWKVHMTTTILNYMKSLKPKIHNNLILYKIKKHSKNFYKNSDPQPKKHQLLIHIHYNYTDFYKFLIKLLIKK